MNTKRIQRIIYTVLVVGAIVLIAVFMFQTFIKPDLKYRSNLNECEIIYKTRIEGIVKDNFRNQDGMLTLLKNNEIVYWYCNSNNITDNLSAGDSIYKPSKTFSTYVFKKANPDSALLIVCEFDCNTLSDL